MLLFVLLAEAGLCQENRNTLEGALQAAREAQASGNYAAAADAYRKAVAADPGVPQLWANLGLMQHQVEDYRGAIVSFRRAHAMNPSLYVPNLFLGIDLFETNDAKEALPFLLRAAELNSRDPEAHLYLGRTYAALGTKTRATAEMERAIQLDSKVPSPWFYLGLFSLDRVEGEARALTGEDRNSGWAKSLYAESLVRQSRYNEAAGVLKEVLAASSRPPCTRAELGVAYLLLHETAQAQQQFRLSEQEQPVCSLATLGEARLDTDSGMEKAGREKLSEAWERDAGFVRISASVLTQDATPAELQRFSAAVEQASQAGDIPAGLAQFLTSDLSGNHPELGGMPASAAPAAEARSDAPPVADYNAGHYGRCERESDAAGRPSDPHRMLLLLRCASLTGDDLVAAQTGEALLKAAPPSPEALYWTIKANEQVAFQALGKYEELAPNSERTHLLVGDIYRQRDRYEDAEVQYRQALVLQPGDPAALLGLAWAQFGNGELVPALATAKEALQHSPSDPEVNLVIGEILVEQHDFTDAESYLKRSLSAKPQMLPHIYALLGHIDEQEGRNQDAIRDLLLGLPSDEDGSVHYQLAQAYRRVGDNKDAAGAMAQVRVIEQRRREASSIAVQDSHPDDPNSLP
jgi:tetratricopeptide (TPR) repeat protein